MDLSPEQKLTFELYLQKENIFLTGAGGTGKSKIIHHIYQHAIENNKRIQVCALTGCAALLLNCKAKTIHSWAGIGIANGSKEEIVDRVVSSYPKKQNWRSVDILIIYEVSIMSLKIFEILNHIALQTRSKYKVFGGIQVIFSGDFYQLPPVKQSIEKECSQFCFESDLWDIVFPKENHIQLIQIFRQKDATYSTILNELRNGIIRRSSLNILLKQVNKEKRTDIQPTKLFPTRAKVDLFNRIEINKLDSESKIFKIKKIYNLQLSTFQEETKKKFSKDSIEKELEYMSSSLLCEESIELKVGCQVMCIINCETPDGFQLCNGSRGIITSFTSSGFPMVKFNDGFEIPIIEHIWNSETIPGIGISQVPLILAWALSIHKSQGMSIDVAEIDVGNDIFECGQSYVALSRVKSLEGLYLTSFDVSKIKINNKVKKFYESF